MARLAEALAFMILGAVALLASLLMFDVDLVYRVDMQHTCAVELHLLSSSGLCQYLTSSRAQVRASVMDFKYRLEHPEAGKIPQAVEATDRPVSAWPHLGDLHPNAVIDNGEDPYWEYMYKKRRTRVWLEDDVNEVVVRSLSMERPRVLLLENFISPEDAQYMIDRAKPHMERATLSAVTGERVIGSHRTSTSYYVPAEDFVYNQVIRRIQRRASLLCGFPLENAEAFNVLHYAPGQQYKVHHDYFDPKEHGEVNEWTKDGGNRVATIVIYLHTPEKGGGTAFPKADLTVPAVQGHAVLFYSSNLDMTLDEMSLHAGLPVEEGDKWIMTRWFRGGPFYHDETGWVTEGIWRETLLHDPVRWPRENKPLLTDTERKTLVDGGQLVNSVDITSGSWFQFDDGVYSRRVFLEVLAWHPRVTMAHHFISDEEIDHIVKLAWPRLERSKVTSNVDGADMIDDIRTSTGCFLGGDIRYNDPVVRALERRIAMWTHTPIENGEDFYFLRYRGGEQYKPHYDWWTDEPHHEELLNSPGGNRAATVIVFLKTMEPHEGGTTDLIRLGMQLRPIKGNALLFWNQDPLGENDDATLHAGRPVLGNNAEKWIMTKWLRRRNRKVVDPKVFDVDLAKDSKHPMYDGGGASHDEL